MSDSLELGGPYPTGLLCPWDSPGKNTWVGCHFLQGTILTQGLNPHPYVSCIGRQVLYHEHHVTAHTSPNWADQHPDLNSTEKSLVNSNLLGRGWEKIPGSPSTPQVRLQISILGTPTYHPRPQTNIMMLSSVCVQKYISEFTWTFLQCSLFLSSES